MREDRNCFEIVLPSLIEVYTRHLFNPDSDIEGRRDVKTADRAFNHAVKKILSRKRKDTWSVSDGLSPNQMFPSLIPQFLGNM